MSRLPIRLKLTLAFAGVMAIVLTATGLIVYTQFKSELTAGIDQGLRTRAADVAALVQQADTGLRDAGKRRLSQDVQSFAQILDPRGAIFDATPPFAGRPLLSPTDLRRASLRPLLVERRVIQPAVGEARLLATAVRAQGKQLVIVTGQSLAVRDAALGTLARLLAIGGAAALLLASACGYGVTAAALRLVESMRRRAAQVTERDLSSRMPVNPSGDELSRLGQTLNGMLERLDRAFKRERTFVDDASHELRSPLAILKAELEVASREGRTLEEVKGAVRSALDEADRLAQLADDLLLVARSDQGRLPMHRSEVRVSDIFAALAQRFALRCRQRNRVIHGAPTELALLGDRRRIEQALGNLIDNSLRHGAGDIRLEARPRDGVIELHVTDQGNGFEAAFLEHAFDRFSRADDSRSEDGAGLGLSLVKAIAEAHGGGGAAANLPAGGADVWISIPVEPRRKPVPTSMSSARAAAAR